MSKAIKKIMKEFPGYFPTKWGFVRSFNNATNVTYLNFENKQTNQNFNVASVADRGYYAPAGVSSTFQGEKIFVPFDKKEREWLWSTEKKWEKGGYGWEELGLEAYYDSIQDISWGDEWNQESFSPEWAQKILMEMEDEADDC